jgi:hypothetical protein
MVRLLNVVELDGEGRVGDQWVTTNLVGTNSSSPPGSSSSLVLSFAHFNESVVYDPCMFSPSLSLLLRVLWQYLMHHCPHHHIFGRFRPATGAQRR